MLNNKKVIKIYKRTFTEVLEFTKDLLNSYVSSSLFKNYITYSSN